ncbi:hypothetical protein EON81_04690 [bacterium]|nr:MAG: hypothetical protein EON81_04690 [bacterium]
MRVSIFLFLGFAASASGAAGVDLKARDEIASGLTFVWDYEYECTIKVFNLPPAAKKQSVNIDFSIPAGTYRTRGTLAIARKAESTVLEGGEPTLDGKLKKVVPRRIVQFSNATLTGRVRYDYLEKSRKNEPYVVEIAASEGGGLGSLPAFGSNFYLPDLNIFLAGMDPRRAFLLPWQQTGNVLKARNYKDAPAPPFSNAQFPEPVLLHCALDEAGRPVGFNWGDDPKLGKRISATAWKTRSGLDLPHEVVQEVIRPDGSANFRFRFRLRDVRKTAELDLPIPKGAWVADYRVTAGPDIGRFSFPPKGAEPASYRYEGKLPTPAELKGAPTLVDTRTMDTNRAPWWAYMLGIGGVLGGVYLIARKPAARSEP